MLRLAVWLNEAVFTDAILERVHYSPHGKDESQNDLNQQHCYQ